MKVGIFRASIAFLIGTVILLAHAIYELDSKENAVKVLLTASIQVFHEIGFALIVSVVIWGLFEYFANEEKEKDWKERTENIVARVFYGALGKSLPQGLINAANSLVLDQSFIRSNWENTFLAETKSFEFSDGRSREFVILTALSSYTVQNISNKAQCFPLTLSISGSRIPSLNRYVRINSVTTNVNGLSQILELEDINSNMQRDLSEQRLKVFLQELVLHPGEKVDVELSFSKVKESSDTEIVAGAVPSESLTVTLVDKSAGKLHLGAAALEPLQLTNVKIPPDLGMKKFKIDNYVLPGQGFQFWWRYGDF